jgi:hypothetical protein
MWSVMSTPDRSGAPGQAAVSPRAWSRSSRRDASARGSPQGANGEMHARRTFGMRVPGAAIGAIRCRLPD